MANNAQKKLAEELKNIRENSKISIDQIQGKTRIDKKYLLAIEEANFSIMPDVYMKAFIKEYASTLNLNPDEILEKYDLAKSDKELFKEEEKVNIETEEVNEKENEENEEKENSSIKKPVIEQPKSVFSESSTTENQVSSKGTNKTLYYVLAGFSILFTIFVIYKIFLVDDKMTIVTEKPFDEIVEPVTPKLKNVNDSESKKSSKEIITEKVSEKKNDSKVDEIYNTQQIIQPVSNMPINLTVIGNGQSWMRVVTDETENTEFIINDNVQKIISAKKQIYLHIGNSGAVKFLLNGNELGFTGSEGRVRKILVTKDGFKYLRGNPVASNEE